VGAVYRWWEHSLVVVTVLPLKLCRLHLLGLWGCVKRSPFKVQAVSDVSDEAVIFCRQFSCSMGVPVPVMKHATCRHLHCQPTTLWLNGNYVIGENSHYSLPQRSVSSFVNCIFGGFLGCVKHSPFKYFRIMSFCIALSTIGRRIHAQRAFYWHENRLLGLCFEVSGGVENGERIACYEFE
jgi:hypothetical protein